MIVYYDQLFFCKKKLNDVFLYPDIKLHEFNRISFTSYTVCVTSSSPKRPESQLDFW